MKKALLFFTLFFFFVFLSAEDVKTGEYDFGDITVTLFEKESPEAEKARKEAEAKEESERAKADAEKKKEREEINAEWKKPVYFQATAGIGAGSSIFAVNADLNLGFLVYPFKKGNLYLGIDAGFRYYPRYYDMISVPLQLNFAVDFKAKNGSLKYAGLWFSIGADMNIDEDACLMVTTAWSMGAEFVFNNNFVLRPGVYGFLEEFPDVSVAIGYRF